MKNSNFAIVCFLLLCSIRLSAQQSDSNESKTRPIQLSFITPLGTNGVDAPQITNRVSINIFAGYNGGVAGIEVAGFSNSLKGDLQGVQAAGFSNQVIGRTMGVQAAGFSNFTKGRLNGAQFAGFANVALDSCHGTQVAGYSNIAIKDITGAQISGFFNYAHRLKGAQIGFVNYCDSVERGVPIGFISIVKHGYKAAEISGDETLSLQGSFKTGVNRLYNIFTLGCRPNGNKTLWAVGYGLGTNINLSKRYDVQIELSSYHINKDTPWTETLSLLNKLKASLSLRLSNRISLFGGVSYNVFMNDKKEETDKKISEDIVPWSARTYTCGSQTLKMYPGFSLGIRFE